ncbi:MAG: tyrosine-type recombinase/integrase [Candidatus Nitrosotenuis sp.]
MQSFLLKEKTKKAYLERLQSLRYSTRENYHAALHRFEQFCNSYYSGRMSEEIIQELKSIPQEQRDDAFFGLLQDFVNWLIGLGLTSTTVNMYFQIVTYYFSYHGIRVHQIDLRQNVKRPKKIKEKLHPLAKEEILRIFAQAPEKRIMLYLVLIGSGMRIQECVALKRKNFDLNYLKRIKIEIPAIYTKAQTAHTTFVSKEAAKCLKPHLEALQENDLVFATNPNPFHAKMTEIEAFTRYRDRAGLTGKYESTNRHYITLHSFRSYFFTRARRVHDTDIAHAMVGHTTYLDMYDRKDDEEKLDLFLKVEKELQIN